MKVAIIGAGRVGTSLARVLAETGDYQVVLADGADEVLARAEATGITTAQVDADRPEALARFLEGFDAVVAALPEARTGTVAAAAIDAGVHYLDFSTETAEVSQLRSRVRSGQVFRPACGISPGLVNDVAAGMIGALQGPVDAAIRVGSLPRTKTNRLGYGLIWNLDGLIAEYTEPGEAIVDGQPTLLPPLSAYERLTLDGRDYEAFTTSGGLGNLAQRFGARIRTLIFRTIRYPGHLDYISLLLDDLKLKHRHDLLRVVLANGLPTVADDNVLVHVTATGLSDGRAVTRTTTLTVHGAASHETAAGSGLAQGSAAYAATVLDLIRTEQLTPSRPMPDQAWNDHLRSSRFLGPLLDWRES